MKKTIIFSTLILVALSFASCSSSQEKVESAEDDVTESNRELEDAKEEYLNDMNSFRNDTYKRIDENNRTISELKVGLKTEKESVRADKLKLITELEDKNNELRYRMDNYKDVDRNKWETFKREFAKDMNNLGQSIKGFGQKSE